jgi:hypothetical protein
MDTKRNTAYWTFLAILIAAFSIMFAPTTHAGLFKIDFGANQNEADDVELMDWDVIPTWTYDDFDDGNAVWNLTDFGGGADSDVTLTMTDEDALGMTGNNPTHENLDVVYDGVEVPYVVKDDYLYRNPDTAGTEILVDIANLNPGRYSVTIFQGRTTDAVQVGRIWVGDSSGSNEPSAPNTGNFSGVDADGQAVPEGIPQTFTFDITEGSHLWYAHMEDNSGGISGMIIRTLVQAQTNTGLFKMDFGANQNDADGVELEDWDVFPDWTFDEFDDGNAVWNLRDFAGGADSDVTLTITDDEAQGMIGNNPTHENLDVIYDTIDVPYVVKDDYLYRNPDTAGTEVKFRISNLDPGRYSVTIFEGRTTDAVQVGRIWVGDVNGSNEPTSPNTGDFSGVDGDGQAIPEGIPVTFSFNIADGEHLWYAHMEDNSGGISGMIVRAAIPLLDGDEDGMPDAWELEFGLNPNDTGDASADCNGNGVSNLDEFKRSLDPCDTTAPSVIETEGSATFTTMKLSFSEPLDPESANNPANYTIGEGLEVLSASYRNVGRQVTLTTSKQEPGMTYSIAINGVSDLSGNTDAASAMVHSFVMGREGVLRFAYWGDATGEEAIPGTSPYDLVDNPRYKGAPDMVLSVFSFNSRDAFQDDTHENFGAVIDGLITPKESGNYDFFLRSDDGAELYISTDASPNNLVFQAEETGCCGAYEEVGANETTFQPISLVAGKSYFIRAIYKEAGGGDYCQVAWRKTTDDTQASRLKPIPGEFLSSVVDLPVPPTPWKAVLMVAGDSQPTSAPTVVDFGALDGDATYEFFFTANKAGASTAIAGNNSFAIKLDQWNEQGLFGTTQFGVADNLFTAAEGQSVASIFGSPAHAVIVNDTGAGESRLYLNGAHAGTWAGNFTLAGETKIMGARLSAETDHMGPGSVMHSWATYDGMLSADAIAAKFAGLPAIDSAGGTISSVGLQDGNVVIEYTGSLKSAGAVTGPYTPVDGASSPYAVTPDQSQAFFIAE